MFACVARVHSPDDSFSRRVGRNCWQAHKMTPIRVFKGRFHTRVTPSKFFARTHLGKLGNEDVEHANDGELHHPTIR